MVFEAIREPSSPEIRGSPGGCCPRLMALKRDISLTFVTRGVRSHSSLSVNSVGDAVRGFIRGLGRRLLRKGAIGVTKLNIFVLTTGSGNRRGTSSIATGDIRDIHVYFRTGERLGVSGTTAHTKRELSLIDLSSCLGKGASASNNSNSRKKNSSSSKSRNRGPLKWR